MPEAQVEPLERLLDSLLWEGYSLYPYTPGAIKNGTPTPFGIVYPPVYAAGSTVTYDHARLECLAALDGEPGEATLSAELRWLEPSGERHEAVARSVAIGPVLVGSRETVEFDRGRFTLRSEFAVDGRARVRACVHNTVEVEEGLDRAGALQHSLISTHIVVRVAGGRFNSPLAGGVSSVNTFPVLAAPADDVVLGATIALPDHPRIAPESLGSLFDGTEIEEALRLHVQVLTDAERAEIEAGDPVVREMVQRAEATVPEDLLALHGRLEMRDPREGEPEVTVEGVTFRRGSTVVLHPPDSADLHARMAAGRRATLERILIDYDGRAHLGVTVDDDPGQQLLRETGRFLYFFADEVEVVE
jgi:hypothetical protein